MNRYWEYEARHRGPTFWQKLRARLKKEDTRTLAQYRADVAP